MKERIKRISVYTMLLLLIIIDQIMKYYIECYKNNLPENIIKGFLKFTYCQNTGIAFGIGAGNVVVFIICNIVALGVLAKFIISKSSRVDIKNTFILGLALSGGISNLIDRIFKGYVVDFIDINQLFGFPIFNFADILICLGVIGFGFAAFNYINTKK